MEAAVSCGGVLSRAEHQALRDVEFVNAKGKASQEVLLLRGFGEFLNEHPSA